MYMDWYPFRVRLLVSVMYITPTDIICKQDSVMHE